jgi:RHH-type proline utilization regulon transcriptional repressor/proline dehydrogenase/delta 1-pyrroline-5-carboxylate dehydrogenase
VRNPADHADIVGTVWPMTREEAAGAVTLAREGAEAWAQVPVGERAAMLERAADLLEARGSQLLGLIIREAGKTAANAVGEVREAVDFLRYYAAQARETLEGTARSGRSCASRRGTSRWRSLPGRLPPPSSRGTRCWPSPRRKPR